MSKAEMIMRSQYMDGEVSHEEYYGQFGKHLISLVGSSIGVDRIKKSTDKHFNDIPLKEWDNLVPAVRSNVGLILRKANGVSGGVSIADCVCAAKSAARMIKEGK